MPLSIEWFINADRSGEIIFEIVFIAATEIWSEPQEAVFLRERIILAASLASVGDKAMHSLMCGIPSNSLFLFEGAIFLARSGPKFTKNSLNILTITVLSVVVILFDWN